jgi:thioredoxin-related protein
MWFLDVNGFPVLLKSSKSSTMGTYGRNSGLRLRTNWISTVKNSITFHLYRSGLLLALLLQLGTACWADDAIPDVTITPLTDLSADFASVAATGKPLMLIFSAEHCFFCERLKENIVKPMLRSGDYDDRVIIRITELDNYASIRGANGEPVDPPDLARAYGVRVTPTVLILGPDGKEAAPRQLGINNEDYYGVYLDEAIAEASGKIAGKPAQASRQ